MGPSELPEDVQRLLREQIESYEQLELLLLLRRERDGPWTEEILTARLGISTSLVLSALAELQAAGFVEERAHGSAKRYAYRVQSDNVEATVARLEQTYREYPIQVVKLMSANAIERVRTAALRTFADAFILKKDKDRG
jgi:hypothetical protein